MTRERIIRLVAGTFVLTSVGLGHFVSPWWLLLGVFVGANLFQSSLTRWCLLEDLLKRGGVKGDAELALERAGIPDAPAGAGPRSERAGAARTKVA